MLIGAKYAARPGGVTVAGTAYEIRQRLGVDSTDRFLLAPRLSAPTLLVVMAHGHGGDEYNTLPSGSLGSLTEASLDQGWAVVGPDAYGPSWGNDNALAEYQSAHDWAILSYPSITTVVLVGQSMGGVPTLIGYKDGIFDNCIAWVGIGCVTSLTVAYFDSYAGSIRNAYGFVGDANLPAAIVGHEPVDEHSSVWAGLFMRFYVSTSDTSVPKVDHADALQAIAVSTAAECSYASGVTGGHLSASHYQPADFVAFVQRALA